MQFLSDLWTIQKWARTQTTFRLYSSSVLLVYDARRLKPVLQYQSKSLSSSSSKLTASCNTGSGPLTGTGTSSTSSSPIGGPSSSPGTPTTGGDIEPLQHYFKIQRSHSAFNNYEEVSYANVTHSFSVVIETIKDSNSSWFYGSTRFETPCVHPLRISDNSPHYVKSAVFICFLIHLLLCTVDTTPDSRVSATRHFQVSQLSAVLYSAALLTAAIRISSSRETSLSHVFRDNNFKHILKNHYLIQHCVYRPN